MNVNRPVTLLLSVLCVLHAFPATAGYVLPPDGGGMLPQEAFPDPKLASSPDRIVENQPFGGTISTQYFYHAPGLPDSSLARITTNGQERIHARTAYSYDGDGRLIRKVAHYPPSNGVSYSMDLSIDLFWKDGRLDSFSTCTLERNEATGRSWDSIVETKIRWQDDRPVERIDRTPQQVLGEGNRTTTATYHGDTLASIVSRPTILSGPPSRKDTVGAMWQYEGNALLQIQHSGWSGWDTMVTINYSARRWIFGTGGRIDSLLDMSNARGSWNDTSNVSASAYVYDGRGRLVRIDTRMPWSRIVTAFEYTGATTASRRLRAENATGGAIHVVEGRILLDLTAPVSASISLYSPDGRTVALVPRRAFPAGAQAIALPAGLPRGLWIVRVDGPGIHLAAPWTNSDR